MKFNTISKAFTIEQRDMELCANELRYIINHIRKQAGLDVRGYDKSKSNQTDAETAECAVLKAAAAVGIDLGADRAGKLNVEDAT